MVKSILENGLEINLMEKKKSSILMVYGMRTTGNMVWNREMGLL